MTRVRLTYRYAEIREDAVSVDLPDHIDPTDSDALEVWAHSSYHYIAAAARAHRQRGTVGSDASIEWENEFYGDVDSFDAEYAVEVIGDTEAAVQ
jgi:hypothetical protein